MDRNKKERVTYLFVRHAVDNYLSLYGMKAHSKVYEVFNNVLKIKLEEAIARCKADSRTVILAKDFRSDEDEEEHST